MELYDRLAPWWPLLSPPEDYAEEAAFYAEALADAAAHTVRDVLELGSGGGNNASHLKDRFRLTLVEPSEGMLALSRSLNPECRHVRGDMRDVRLEERFDAVFVHDAICYMTSEEDLRRAMETALAHLRPGGSALFAPDYVRETFEEASEIGGGEGSGRALQFLAWTWDPEPADDTYRVDWALLLRDEDGTVEAVHETHEEGLFARDRWLALLEEVGFERARSVTWRHSEVERALEVLVARRPPAEDPAPQARRRGAPPRR